MTRVRQKSPTVAARKAPTTTSATAGKEARKPGGSHRTPRKGHTAQAGTKVAQVRLQPDEMAALEAAVLRLNLASTSEALREGLRLLVREAAEVQAADEIRTFYKGGQVPLPDGVAPATEAELRAADEAQW